MNRLFLYTALASVALASAAWAGNQSTLVENGSSNNVTVAQTGNNISNATINGDTSVLNIQQVGEGNIFGGETSGSSAVLMGTGQSVAVQQTGVANVVAIAHMEGVGNNAQFLQNGTHNYGDITVTGAQNAFSFTQYGGGNVAYSDVQGGSNHVTYSQISADGAAAGQGNIIGGTSGIFSPNDHSIRGDANNVTISQIGSNVALYQVAGSTNNLVVNQNNWPGPLTAKNNAEVSILGSNNDVNVGQTGINNTSKIFITASGNIAHTLQNGTGNFSLITQTNGTGNQATVNQTGTSNTSNIAQNGSGNTANVTQH